MTQYGEGRRSSYPIWKVGTHRLRNRSDPRNHPKRHCSRGVTGGFPPARSRETGHARNPSLAVSVTTAVSDLTAERFHFPL